MGGIEDTVIPDKCVLESGLGASRIPAPLGEGGRGTIGSETDGFNTTCVNEEPTMVKPGMVEGAKPVFGIVDIVVHRHDDGFRELPEGRNQFFE